VLKWLREKGCPWNADVCDYAAAMNDNFQMLAWARTHGCHWEARTCWRAAKHGAFGCTEMGKETRLLMG
jgi:hypothetical protein